MTFLLKKLFYIPIPFSLKELGPEIFWLKGQQVTTLSLPGLHCNDIFLLTLDLCELLWHLMKTCFEDVKTDLH